MIEDLIGRFPPAGMPFEPQEVDSPEINMSDDEKARLARLPPQDGALQVHHTTRAMVSKRELDTLKKITRKSTGESGVANSTRMLLGAAYPALHALDKDKWKLLVELLGGMGLERGLGEQTEVEGVGILGYRALSVERVGGDPTAVLVTFEQADTGRIVKLKAPGGELTLRALPRLGEVTPEGIVISPRMLAQLSTMLQLHCMGRDVCLLPSALASKNTGGEIPQTQSSSSTSTSISLFAACLGYPLESLHLFKDISGQELIMRRSTTSDGSTTWEAAPLLKGALEGKMVHLSGVDTLGPTLGSLSRLTTDRQVELWNGNRALLRGDCGTEEGGAAGLLSPQAAGNVVDGINPSFRMVATAAAAKGDWLDEEASTLFGFVQPSPMDPEEERDIIFRRTQCGKDELDKLLEFAALYRKLSADPVSFESFAQAAPLLNATSASSFHRIFRCKSPEDSGRDS